MSRCHEPYTSTFAPTTGRDAKIAQCRRFSYSIDLLMFGMSISASNRIGRPHAPESRRRSWLDRVAAGDASACSGAAYGRAQARFLRREFLLPVSMVSRRRVNRLNMVVGIFAPASLHGLSSTSSAALARRSAIARRWPSGAKARPERPVDMWIKLARRLHARWSGNRLSLWRRDRKESGAVGFPTNEPVQTVTLRGSTPEQPPPIFSGAQVATHDFRVSACGISVGAIHGVSCCL
jgi:hypothetical protein